MGTTTKCTNLNDDATASIITLVLESSDAEELVFYALHSPDKFCAKYNINYSGKSAQLFADELCNQYYKKFPKLPHNFEVNLEKHFNSSNNSASETKLSKIQISFLANYIFEKIRQYSSMDLKSCQKTGKLLRSKPEDFAVSTERQEQIAKRNWFFGIRSLFSINNFQPNTTISVAEKLLPYHEIISELYDEFLKLSDERIINEI